MLPNILSYSLYFQAWQRLSRVYTKPFDFGFSTMLIGDSSRLFQMRFLFFHNSDYVFLPLLLEFNQI